MSLARSDTAASNTSSSARTTGAPLARSRRLSDVSGPASASSTGTSASLALVRASASRASSTSSKLATSVATAPPSVIATASIASALNGSAAAIRSSPPSVR